MKCPNCKNTDEFDSEISAKPVKAMRTDRFDTVQKRYYLCLQCGKSWVTVEQFERFCDDALGRPRTNQLNIFKKGAA